MENVEPGIRDPDEVVKVAGELMNAVKRLEGGVGGEVDRKLVEGLVTPLDVASGQAFKVEIGEVTFYANQSENVPRSQEGTAGVVERKRPQEEPDLGRGRFIRRDDDLLAKQGRFALTTIVNAVINSHVKVVVDHERVHVEPRNFWGAALLQIAEQLRQGQPADLSARRLRLCERCGQEFVGQRRTRRFCSTKCERAMRQARKRTQQENTQ